MCPVGGHGGWFVGDTNEGVNELNIDLSCFVMVMTVLHVNSCQMLFCIKTTPLAPRF